MVPDPSHSGEQSSRLTVRLSDKEKQELNEIAHELSEPGAHVTPSDVVREAFRDYKDKFHGNRDSCVPTERGCLEPVEIEENGGTADA